MIGLPDGVRVYLAAGRTDLRRGIDGLAAQIQTVLRENPFSGHLFIFRGRAAHTIKVLMYDGSGFLLMQKRLTEGKFIGPSPADGIVTISRAQMSLLIDGLDWRSTKARPVAKPLFISPLINPWSRVRHTTYRVSLREPYTKCSASHALIRLYQRTVIV